MQLLLVQLEILDVEQQVEAQAEVQDPAPQEIPGQAILVQDAPLTKARAATAMCADNVEEQFNAMAHALEELLGCHPVMETHAIAARAAAEAQ
jgi:hypothetical protein